MLILKPYYDVKDTRKNRLKDYYDDDEKQLNYFFFIIINSGMVLSSIQNQCF